MTNYYAAFVHGASTFLLDGTRGLTLAPGWTPPGLNVNVGMSTGLMRNRRSGGTAISKQYVNRDLPIPIYAKGSSSAETHGTVSQLESFIERSLADQSDKLYFVFGSSNAITYTPKWGQLFMKYEIRVNHGSFPTGGNYGTASVREQFVSYTLPLEAAPFATGERQRIASATGGILEHTWATEHGLSRGLVIPGAFTNYVQNPIFGHSTWNTGWTDGGDVDSYQNTDKKFVLFGNNSAKVVSVGATNRFFRTSVTLAASTHTLGIIAKLPDGGAVSSPPIVLLYNGGALTETYRHLGDDLYLVYANETGTGGAANFDIFVTEGHTAYIGYAFATDTDYPVAPLYGDLLDCAWSSTAHNSDSTRTAARWRIATDDFFDLAEWAIHVTWIAPYDSDTIPDFTRIWEINATTNIEFRWVTNAWRLTDGTNNADASGGDSTFSEGDILDFICVGGPNGLVIYKNGASIASNATYTISDSHDYFYLGSSAAVGNHNEGTHSNLVSWNREITAAEALAYNNNISPYVNGGDGLGQCINPIPWAWFDQGDDILDNDYVAGSLYNFLFAGGIPGNATSKTEWFLDIDTAGVFTVILALQKYNYKDVNLTDILGTIDITGSTLSNVNTTDRTLTSHTIPQSQRDGNYYVYFRCTDAGSNLVCKDSFVYGAFANEIYSEDKSIVPDGDYKAFMTHQVNPNISFGKNAQIDSLQLKSYVYRSVAGAADVVIDYGIAMKDPLTIYSSTGMNSRALDLCDKTAFVVSSGTPPGSIITKAEVIGKSQNLDPNNINFLVQGINSNGQNSTTTHSATYNIHITPRWSLL